ncbi:hypothetical protein [Pleurocapsa sp. FMAR1]|nr:hypothetical protein [Pleurocapsa sp. FMAR1]
MAIFTSLLQKKLLSLIWLLRGLGNHTGDLGIQEAIIQAYDETEITDN